MSDPVQQAAPLRRGLPLAPARRSHDTLLLAGLFLGALALRAWGVQWSLPYVGHVDEPKIVDAAVHIVKTGDLNPHLFIWPSAVIYGQALIDKLNLLWGTWRGYYHGPDSLPDSNHIFAVAPDLYLWGRLFSATVGAVAVAGVYALGRRLVGRVAALIAAGLLATSPLHVEYSHYLVTDVTMGAAGLLALAAAWHLLQQPSRRRAVLAGAAVGLAAATKYNGLYTVIPVATAWAYFGARAAPTPRPPPLKGEGERDGIAPRPPPLKEEGEHTAPTPRPPPLKGEGELDGLTSARSSKEEKTLDAISPSPFRGGGRGVGAVAAPADDPMPNSELRIQNSELQRGGGGGERAARALRAALILCSAGLAVFLLLNPYVVLDWREWSRGFVFQVNAYLPADSLTQVATAAGKQGDQLWRSDAILLAAGLFGGAVLLAEAVLRRKADPHHLRVAALLLPFPLLYWLLMSRFTEVYVRNLIVTLPYLALTGGYGVAAVGRGLGAVVSRQSSVAGRQSPVGGPTPSLIQNSEFRIQNSLALLLGLLLIAEPARRVVNFDLYMADTESRNAAWVWLQGELAAGRRAAVELHPLQACAAPVGGCAAPDVWARNAPLTVQPPSWYADHGYDYALLVGNEVAVVGDNLRRGPAYAAAWAALPVVRVFGGDAVGGKGPSVRVLRVGTGAEGLLGYTRSGARFGAVADLWGYALAPLPTAGAPFDPASLPSALAPTRSDEPAGGVYKPGAAIGVRLAWRGQPGGARVLGNWTVALHLLDAAGQTVAQVDVLPISSGHLRPVSDWYSEEFLDGSYNIPLPPTLPSGTYRLTLSLYDAPTGRALPVQAPSGAAGPLLELGSVTVVK